MAGFRGTFVISWQQTEIDGVASPGEDLLRPGAAWRWRGDMLRVDGPAGVLGLEHPEGEADLRRSAARMVHKLVGTALAADAALLSLDDPVLNAGFEVTDGRESYAVTVIRAPGQRRPLLMFVGNLPPRNTELWVVRLGLQPQHINRITDQPTGVICFAGGTRILTERGEVAVDELAEGDRIQTKDNGVQAIRWIGHRRMSGARLHAMPELRPVRVRAGGLGPGQPDGDLLVSPQHRMLVRGARATELFNCDEVFVSASDLIDGVKVHVDRTVREVTYYHLLLDNHEVVFANGLETESFHPASAPAESIALEQRARLLERFPEIEVNPGAFGDYARRMLTAPEAAILVGA